MFDPQKSVIEPRSSKPEISVVIACYNAARYLPETVASVTAQAYKNYEIIIIDDGSTDSTPEQIRSFGNSVRAEFVSHAGVCAARNLGTRLAKGEFIQYLDADDLLRPDALEKRVQALLSSQADVAYSDWQKLVEQQDGRFVPGEIVKRHIEDIDPDPEIALFTEFWAPPAALLYRKALIDKIGDWDDRVAPIEDARFLLMAFLRGGRFVYVPGIGADYRVVLKGSHSRSDPVRFLSSIYKNASLIEEEWKNGGGISLKRQHALLQVFNYVARDSFRRDKALFKKAVQELYRLDAGFRPLWPKTADFLLKLFGPRASVFLMNVFDSLRSPRSKLNTLTQ